jgi:hypothetical protein
MLDKLSITSAEIPDTDAMEEFTSFSVPLPDIDTGTGAFPVERAS